MIRTWRSSSLVDLLHFLSGCTERVKTGGDTADRAPGPARRVAGEGSITLTPPGGRKEKEDKSLYPHAGGTEHHERADPEP